MPEAIETSRPEPSLQRAPTAGRRPGAGPPFLLLRTAGDAGRLREGHWRLAGRNYFDRAFRPADTARSRGREALQVCRSTTGAEMEVEPGGSMLAALWELGAKVDASCEGGICGACEVRWLEGEPIHRDRALAGTAPDPPDGLRRPVRVGTVGRGGLTRSPLLLRADQPNSGSPPFYDVLGTVRAA